MSVGQLAPTSNHVLASLPSAEYRSLFPWLEPVQLDAGAVLEECHVAQSQVVFPCSGIVSMNYQLADGASVAIAVVGCEAIVGVSVFLDGALPSGQSIVQVPGQGFRLDAATVRTLLRKGGQLQVLALRSIQAMSTQMAQTAVCNRHHNLDQQICRWLLLTLDRVPGNELNMTHELIAQMLGVRREGVTAAAGKLQDAGVINYSRGRIAVLERSALEARVCECYRVVRKEYHRLLPIPAGFCAALQ
ncbi:MAG: Crp/Fnr family transcriptional regulator [Arenimonas sp.]